MLVMKKIVSDMKNVFCGLISRPSIAKERTVKLENSSVEITQTKTQKEKE